MIYLTTGSNGTGKTLFTLKRVRELQLKDNRPVYYHGFAMKPEKASEFGWKECDPKEWQSLPDGSIVLWDECQNDMPTAGNGAAVPEFIKALGEHRRRGFDFFLLTQHPQNISLFVRRLIGSPGWHAHLKRPFGQDGVSRLQWNYVNASCEKPGSGKDAEVSVHAFPKEVYGWYESAMLHTGKKTIPRPLLVLGALALVIPVLFWYGFTHFGGKGDKPSPTGPMPAMMGAATPSASVATQTAGYLDSYKPRVPGLPYTAPRYDKITEAIDAPRPAACVHMQKSNDCRCYTQQGTRINDVSQAFCLAIVKDGFFQDFKTLEAPVRPVAAADPSLETNGVPKGANSVPAAPAVGAGGMGALPPMSASQPHHAHTLNGKVMQVAQAAADYPGAAQADSGEAAAAAR